MSLSHEEIIKRFENPDKKKKGRGKIDSLHISKDYKTLFYGQEVMVTKIKFEDKRYLLNGNNFRQRSWDTPDPRGTIQTKYIERTDTIQVPFQALQNIFPYHSGRKWDFKNIKILQVINDDRSKKTHGWMASVRFSI